MIQIEPATLDVILPLRAEVLRDAEPIEAAHFDGDHDAGTLHLAAFGGSPTRREVVGCVSLIAHPMPEREAWTHQLRGMAVAPPHRSRGVGAALLAELDRRTPDRRLWCNARVPAQRFYERHGWAAVGQVFEVPGHGPHVRMQRVAHGLPKPRV